MKRDIVLPPELRLSPSGTRDVYREALHVWAADHMNVCRVRFAAVDASGDIGQFVNSPSESAEHKRLKSIGRRWMLTRGMADASFEKFCPAVRGDVVSFDGAMSIECGSLSGGVSKIVDMCRAQGRAANGTPWSVGLLPFVGKLDTMAMPIFGWAEGEPLDSIFEIECTNKTAQHDRESLVRLLGGTP